MIQFQVRIRILGKKVFVEPDTAYREDTIPTEETLGGLLEKTTTETLIEWATKAGFTIQREQIEDYFARFEPKEEGQHDEHSRPEGQAGRVEQIHPEVVATDVDRPGSPEANPN
jgi:hypothetical protein